MIANCDFCKKEYKTFKNWYDRAKTHTCSRECAWELKKQQSTKNCKNCNKYFYSKYHQKDKLFCSRECARINSRLETEDRNCPVCNKNFIYKKGGFHDQKTCSIECGRQLITIQRCTKFKCTVCEKEYFRNKYWLSKTKDGISKFCSKKCKNIKQRGENHPNYNPNKKLEKDKLREWSKRIKERDGYKCKKCGSKDDLHAHHIKERSKFKELSFVLENGITLCNICHAEEHKENINIYNLILKNSKNGKKELDKIRK